jgi:predicted ATPase/DNA-binding SARP family transcriptional activator
LRVEFRLLGPVEALADGRRLALGGPKQRALLAELLLLHGGAVLPRDHLVDALWGEHPPSSARSSLQVYVHGLRRVLGPERIETHGTGYRVCVDPDELDSTRFERLIDDAERALADGLPADAAEDLARALALWAGPPLADVADHPVARTAAPRLEELHLRALELHNDARLALGEHDAVLPELDSLVKEHPYRERLREQQVLALYRAGRQQEALEAYRAARDALVEELGIEPGPALQALERAVLRQDETLAAPAAPARRPALPSPPTSLVGRRLEIAAVEAMLRRDDIRLVTLTGPGGTGKTRLALAVAQSLAKELREGAVFVDLSAVTEPELVLPAVAQALGLPSGEDALAAVAGLSLLLVLDNLEQLGVETLPGARLVAASPRLRVLATSRTPLRLSGEHEYPVPPLPVPDPANDAETLTANDAVRLFTARAQAANPAFAPSEEELRSIAGICRRLDGLPLALELAAARVRVLAPTEIEPRLDAALTLLVEGARDLPPRQQTLRATLDWSYRLLAERERTLLARLAVFAGGFRLEDAEAIAGQEPAASLAALVEHGLLRRRDGRVTLLETIRQYALEKLAEQGEEQAFRGRHCERFLAVAGNAWAAILEGGEAEAEAFALLDAEHENVHAAIAWAEHTEDVDRTIGFATALRWYWLVRGRFAEGLRVFEHALALTAERPAAHAFALSGAGILNVRRGERAVGTEQLSRALELFRELDDEPEIARCTAELGHVAVEEGELDRATELYTGAVDQFRRLGNTTREAVALANLAAIAARRGESATAAEHGRRAIALQRQIGDVDGLGVSLANLGRVELALGDEQAACASLHESLDLAIRLDYRMLIAYLLGAAGEIARRRGLHDQSGRLVGAAVGLFERIGMRVPDEEHEEHEATLAPLREKLGGDAVAALLREGAATPVESMLAQASELTADR